MGSDLSVVFRACVPAPHTLCELQQQQPQQPRSFGAIERESSAPVFYNELRLVEKSTSNLETSVTLSNEKAEVFSQLISEECTPQMLSTLNLEDAAKFSFLHEGLRCEKCAGKIGLAVHSSVCIGQRLYSAGQRHVFTQSLSIFLSKLAAVLKTVAAPCQSTEVECTDNESLVADDLVKTPCETGTPLQYELFLLDLQNGFLDNVSGPWLVREFVDHMGRALHHHSALSLLCGSDVRPMKLSNSVMETGSSVLSRRSSRTLIHLPTNDSWRDVSFWTPDATQISFCGSLRHVILSSNNMSLIGLRKCILELVNYSESGDQTSVKSLQTVDVRENEESTAAQHFAAEIASFTGVNVIMGTSGRRWRHRLMYSANDSASRASVGSPSVTHSVFESNPKRSFFSDTASVDRQGGNDERMSATFCLRDKRPPLLGKYFFASAASLSDTASTAATTAAAVGVGGGQPKKEERDVLMGHNGDQHKETGRSLTTDEMDATARQEGCDAQSTLSTGNLIVTLSSPEANKTKGREVNKGQFYSEQLGAADEVTVGSTAACDKPMVNTQEVTRADFPAACIEKQRGATKRSSRQNFDVAVPLNDLSKVQCGPGGGVQKPSAVSKAAFGKRGTAPKMAVAAGTKASKTPLVEGSRSRPVQRPPARQ